MAPPNKKLRLALLGCGRIAQVHWKGIQESASSLVHVSACIDIFQQRAEEMALKVSEATGEPCGAFASQAEALAADAFDAVDIMLLHNQHEQAAIEAFAAGKAVLLEKPMSITIESCERIMAAADEAGTLFMVAEQEEYAPAILTCQRLILEGAIGDVITASSMGNSGNTSQHLKRNPSAGGQNAVLEAAGMPPVIHATVTGHGSELPWASLYTVLTRGGAVSGCARR